MLRALSLQEGERERGRENLEKNRSEKGKREISLALLFSSRNSEKSAFILSLQLGDFQLVAVVDNEKR